MPFLNMAEDGEYWWFPGYWINALFKMDKTSKQIQWVCDFKQEVTFREAVYSRVVPYRNLLFFLPQNSFHISVYDKIQSNIMTLDIECSNRCCGFGTAGHVVEENFLYIFSVFPGCLPVKVNMNTFSIEYIKEWATLVQELYTGEYKYFINSVVQMDNRIFLGIYGTNRIIEFMPENNSYREILSLESTYEIGKIAGDGLSSLCVIPRLDGPIHVYNVSNGKMDRYWEHEKDEYVNIYFTAKEILLIPRYGKVITIIDRKDRAVKRLEIPVDDLFLLDASDNRFFYTGMIKDDNIFLYPYRSKGIVVIDRKKDTIQMLDVMIDKDFSDEAVIQKYLLHAYAVPDEIFCPFELWEKSIGTSGKKVESAVTCGLSIFKLVKG